MAQASGQQHHEHDDTDRCVEQRHEFLDTGEKSLPDNCSFTGGSHASCCSAERGPPTPLFTLTLPVHTATMDKATNPRAVCRALQNQTKKR
jgi:hypothetical protein